MGRLMLNVLLSFAQFEREVTGERIRDKIAASKAKGMWMGGNLPLGYDLPAAGTRNLAGQRGEAATVRHIFARYLEIGSVHALQRELRCQGIVLQAAHYRHRPAHRAAEPFSRGALFHLLRNRIYLGQIVHKDQVLRGRARRDRRRRTCSNACRPSSMAMRGATAPRPITASPRRRSPASCSMQMASR